MTSISKYLTGLGSWCVSPRTKNHDEAREQKNCGVAFHDFWGTSERRPPHDHRCGADVAAGRPRRRSVMSDIDDEHSQAADCEAMLEELRARRALIARRLAEERRQIVQEEAVLEETISRRTALGDQKLHEHDNRPVEGIVIS
eukprot:CAMPEP_0172920266 /NCGR_PEP_ID=MMETSP1075-20121228/203740_1 /TAXON_ID=2916 /ORGANISM="Ceratium fusus, Strain PA161109" /LENGTH=142 /DNA_ID=CAMNT_0013780257 /DNA_START=67 /DNA_END=492 /DNA_ORIENTATION=+